MANYVCIFSNFQWRHLLEIGYTNLETFSGSCLTTYIIGHYNPSVRIIDLVSHTNYVVCGNFIHLCRDLQFKVDSERQIFLRNFSCQFLFILRVFAKNLLRGNRQRNTFRILV